MFRGGSRTAAISKMERFLTIVNGFQPLTIITKRSILDVAAVLDPPLMLVFFMFNSYRTVIENILPTHDCANNNQNIIKKTKKKLQLA